ncbi:MAG: 4-oxalocrotonate tautomerase [Azonexaceae bacterium]|nr:4-oxalocrotonate tautomerase [Azonexaceae bacterium]
MPLVQITLSGPPLAPDAIAHLQREATRLMADILGKDAALTVVSVTQLPLGASSADGRAVPTSASLQAMITAGTNSAAEKADFIFAAKSLLTVAIGQSQAPVYVALHEIPADSWGYDGETQAARKAGQLQGEAA